MHIMNIGWISSAATHCHSGAQQRSLVAALALVLLIFAPVSATWGQSQASIDLAQQMYVAYYGRPGDPGGINFWAQEFDQSPDLGLALSAFGSSLEYEQSFGSLTNEQLVAGLYAQLFNRAPDPGGLAFYVDRLTRGVSTLANIAKQIADGTTGSDVTTLNNKIRVANALTAHVETEGVEYQAGDIPTVQALLASVDGSEASVASALEEAARFKVDHEKAPASIVPIIRFLLRSGE